MESTVVNVFGSPPYINSRKTVIVKIDINSYWLITIKRLLENVRVFPL